MTVILPGGLGQLYAGKAAVTIDSNTGNFTSFSTSATFISGVATPTIGTAILLYLNVTTTTDQTANLGCTWGSGGPSFTQIGKLLDATIGVEQLFYGLANVSTSGDQNVFFTSASVPTGYVAGLSFNGANKTTPFINFKTGTTASGTALSLTVTSGNGHMVAGAFTSPNGIGTVNLTQWIQSGGVGVQTNYGAGASPSKVVSTTGNATGRISGIGVDISN